MVAEHNTISLHISKIAAITVHYLTKKLHFILLSHRKLSIRLCISDYMIWCDVVWYDIWYDVIYDMIWCDMIYDMMWYYVWYDVIWYDMRYDVIWYMIWCDMIYDTMWYMMYDINNVIYLLTAIGLTLDGSSKVPIYTQKIHRTTQWNRIQRTEHT
jgi:hypothetical protein